MIELIRNEHNRRAYCENLGELNLQFAKKGDILLRNSQEVIYIHSISAYKRYNESLQCH